MAVTYSINNGAVTGTINTLSDWWPIRNSNKATMIQCSFSGKLDGDNVNLASLVYDCTNLTSLDVSNLDVSNVVKLESTFYGASALEELDLSNWNTNTITSMTNTFSMCTSLKSVNISNLDTRNVTDMQAMFYGDSNLEHIYVGNNWSTDAITGSNSYRMFEQCTKLPNFNSSYTNKTRAYVGTGGYLEYAPTPTPTVPEIHIGDTTISAIKIGDTEISKIYLGTEEL